MDREPIGTGRLPPLGGCRATIFVGIGVDLPIPKKPTLTTARWWPAWRVAIPVRNGVQARQRWRSALDPVGCLRPQPRQRRGVVPGPSTADPAPRGCSAVAAAPGARAADAPGRRPAAP